MHTIGIEKGTPLSDKIAPQHASALNVAMVCLAVLLAFALGYQLGRHQSLRSTMTSVRAEQPSTYGRFGRAEQTDTEHLLSK
jgi:hypothetical protein